MCRVPFPSVTLDSGGIETRIRLQGGGGVEVQVRTDTRNRNVSDLKVVVVGNVRQYILESEIKLQT